MACADEWLNGNLSRLPSRLPFRTSHSMIVRPFQPSDLDQVIGVYRDAIHTLAAPFYTSDQLAAWAPPHMDPEKWRVRLAAVRALIADNGSGVVAGFLTYDLAGHLDMLFTRPSFARQGIATRLYQDAEADLRRAAISSIFTEASLAARPFFERMGFHVDAEEFAECRGQQLRRFRMSKQVPAV